MLQITIPSAELWDEIRSEFVYSKERVLQLEHSLVSLSKWESKWNVPFLTKEEKSIEKTIDYIKCMTITQNVSDETYNLLTDENIQEIDRYMNESMTATWFVENKGTKINREQVTSELIYYWMSELKIPIECQKWHLNRLITLIRVYNEKNKPPKKMNRKEIMSRNTALNEARKKQLNTKG